MALSDRLVSSRFPYLPIHLELRDGGTAFQEADLEALIDTGFDGDVIAPAALLTNGPLPASYLSWELADGSEVLAPAYRGTVTVGQLGTLTVIITALGDEPMIGRTLVSRFRVTLDHGQQVIVEP